MIVNNDTQEIVNNTGMEKRGFSIKANAKAFDLLFNSLYSDPMSAMIREVAANAADAHIAAGCPDKAITVHIPNVLEPWFVFKDEGVGMTEDVVANIYTTVFESTKDSSNAETGGFGLGCKTPYAMGDNFTVVTVKDGVRNEYLMYRDEQRNPAYLQTSSTKTDEPNGTTVTVPYNKEQGTFDEIRRKAINILSMFSCPVKTNFDGLRPYKEGLVDMGEGVLYAPAGTPAKTNSIVNVVMANICYPVDTRELGNDFYYMFGMPVFINIPNGSVDLTPSRESMQYTPRTISFLKGAMHKAKKTAKAYVAEQYKGNWEQRFNAYATLYHLLREEESKCQEHYYLTVKDPNKEAKFKDFYYRDMYNGTRICSKKEVYTFILEDVLDDTGKVANSRNLLNRARDYLSTFKGISLHGRVVYAESVDAIEELSAQAYDGDKSHIKYVSIKEIMAEYEVNRKEELDKKKAERKAKYKTGGILACVSLKGTVTEISVSDLTDKHLMIDLEHTVNAERANHMLKDRYDSMLTYAYQQGYIVCIARLKEARLKTANHPKLSSIYKPALDALVKQYPDIGARLQVIESVYYSRQSKLGKPNCKASDFYDISSLHKFEVDYLESMLRTTVAKDVYAITEQIPSIFREDVYKATRCEKFSKIVDLCNRDVYGYLTNYMSGSAAYHFLSE